jgi:hypothetical protein
MYSDEVAAKETRGKADKLPLTSSPFVMDFEYGANNQKDPGGMTT